MKGAGCPACGNSGYKGRVAAFELLPATAAVRAAVAKRAWVEVIRTLALKEGQRPMRQAAVAQVKAGLTTMEEFRQAGLPWTRMPGGRSGKRGRLGRKNGPEDRSMALLALDFHPDKRAAAGGSGAPLAGLDLGTSSLKLVALKREGEGYTLAGLHLQESRTAVETTAGRLGEEAGFPVRDVAIAVPGQDSLVRLCEVPKASPAAFRKNLPLEIEQYLPVNVKESVVDGQILGDSETEAGKMSVVMGAVGSGAARELVRLARHLRVEPRVVDAEALALANMFAHNYAADEAYQGTVCLINAGTRVTYLLIFDGGEIRFSHPVAYAGEAKSGEFVAEIKRCFDYYDSQFPSHGVGRILFGGGDAGLEGLDVYLSGKLGVPVELLDPFRKIKVNSMAPGVNLVRSRAAAFGVAVGLAMRTAP